MRKSKKPDLKDFVFYECKKCKKLALDFMGAIGHARKSHGIKVHKDQILKYFTIAENPPAEMVEALLRKRKYQHNSLERKRQGKPASDKSPRKKRSTKNQPSQIPKVLGVQGVPELVPDGVILTLQIKFPIAFGMPEIL